MNSDWRARVMVLVTLLAGWCFGLAGFAGLLFMVGLWCVLCAFGLIASSDDR